MRALVGLLALLMAGPAFADNWLYTGDGPEKRFGYVISGSSDFLPIYFSCGGGRIVVSAEVGQTLAEGETTSVTIQSGAGSVKLTGAATLVSFTNSYWIQVFLRPGHPIFGLLAAGEPVRYTINDNGKSGLLNAAGQQVGLAAFLADCDRF